MSKGQSVVAAGHELTAAAAAEILQDGGNAFDAAMAGTFMSFVAEAVFASPGGGGFLMARRAESDAPRLFDFFAETPLKRRPAREVEFIPIHADFGPAKQEFHIGLGSSATLKAATVDVETESPLLIGPTVADWVGHWKREPNADIAVSTDPAEFFDRLVHRVGNYARVVG